MKSHLAFAAVALALGFATAAGQTKREIESKYGPSKDGVYAPGAHIRMTPAYAADGQICLVRLYPKLPAPGTNKADESLVMDEVLNFIDDLVPRAARGARKDLFGVSDMGGGAIWTHFFYDRVTFTFESHYSMDKLPAWPVAGEALALDLDSDVDEKKIEDVKRKEAMRPDNDIIREKVGKPKYLMIGWTERKCD